MYSSVTETIESDRIQTILQRRMVERGTSLTEGCRNIYKQLSLAKSIQTISVKVGLYLCKINSKKMLKLWK